MSTGIKFNQLLQMHCINPEDVKLYKHNGRKDSIDLYQVWQSNKNELIAYQSYQTRNLLNREYLASFVSTATSETLFVGLYKVLSRRQHHEGSWDFEFEECKELKGVEGKLLINWKNGKQTCRKAENENPDVVYIKEHQQDEVFSRVS